MDGWVMGDFLLFSPEAAGGARKRIIDHQPSAISHQPSAISHQQAFTEQYSLSQSVRSIAKK
jgi:hypothetical protein